MEERVWIAALDTISEESRGSPGSPGSGDEFLTCDSVSTECPLRRQNEHSVWTECPLRRQNEHSVSTECPLRRQNEHSVSTECPLGATPQKWDFGVQDGSDPSEVGFWGAQELGGGRAVSLKETFTRGFKALNLKA